MSLQSEVNAFSGYLSDAYNAVETMGGSASGYKNLANLSSAVDSIPTTPPYDPSNPTLDGVKAAINAGDYSAFPPGTEIPDEYDGHSNPLIVAQYLDSTNNSSYGGAEGGILVRKYVEPTSQKFGANIFYTTSDVKTYLDTTYYSNCSNALKSVLSNINIPYYDYTSSSIITINCKIFLMSAYEVCNQGNNGTTGYEGINWNYWKQKTGLSTPDALNIANNGRIMNDRAGTATYIWLRSYYNNINVCAVTNDGKVRNASPTATIGVLPACFIAKD